MYIVRSAVIKPVSVNCFSYFVGKVSLEISVVEQTTIYIGCIQQNSTPEILSEIRLIVMDFW